jgi:flagellar assembly protein FliH
LTKSNKFLFDLNNFDAPEEEEIIENEEEIEELEPPPPTFSEEELETAKAVSHAAGRSEGIKEERARREQFVAESLKTITDNFSTLFAAEIYREKQYEEESLKLALQIIDMVAPSLSSRLGYEALKQTLKDVIKSQSEQSEIIIEVNPEYAADIDSLMEDMWTDKENAPRYKILADSGLEKGACKLSWKDGGMIRDPAKTANDIKTSIEDLLVEQVMKTHNSPLTDKENNAINSKQQEDSVIENPEPEARRKRKRS